MEEEKAKTKIEVLDEKIKQLQAQKHKILSQEKEKQRKQRTRRLIQIGAISEKFFGEFETAEAFEDYLKRLKAEMENNKLDDSKKILLQIGYIAQKHFGYIEPMEFEKLLTYNSHAISSFRRNQNQA